MNSIYKLKFSRKTDELVAVGEIATNAVAQTCAHPVTNELSSYNSSLQAGTSLSQTLIPDF